MSSNYQKKTTRFFCVAIGFLLLSAGLFAQQINLSAGPSSAVLPDGQSIPMWGYTCGAAVSGSSATCAPLNPASASKGQWSPVVITVPVNASGATQLQINLANNLMFGTQGGAPNGIPTSLMIAGQLGGGLGALTQSCNPATGAIVNNGGSTCVASPVHEAQATTWTVANVPGAINNPPPQHPRVQSFGTEVAASPATASTTTALTWSNLRPGTYLIESGTHPSIQVPMGLYGILVVTSTPSGSTAGAAYTGVSYNAEVPVLFSEIDPAQNRAVSVAVGTPGFAESATLGSNAPEPVATVKVLSGGANYTTAPNVKFSNGGTGTATIDTTTGSPTFGQVIGITVASGGTPVTSAPTVVISGGGGAGATAQAALILGASTTCSGGASACYPPVVNYTPLYYLVNGAAFDKNNPGNSLYAVTPAPAATTPTSGSILVRMVNAGLRMHVPSIVGSQTGSAASGFTLVAEDGNPVPGAPRVQSEVFMAAGKTYDVMINTPAAGGTALPVFDRQLSLSSNATGRDSGMLAYISVNGSGLPAAGAIAPASAIANPDSYLVVPGQTLTVSDPSKGVIANDVNIYGVTVQTLPAQGTLTLKPDGTFSYVPKAGWTADSFAYCGNGATSNGTSATGPCTTVSLGAATIEDGSNISCIAPSYTAKTAKYVSIARPGLLAGCTDKAGYPLSVNTGGAASQSVTPTSGSGTITLYPDGSFTASATAAGTVMFSFTPQNSQGTKAAASVTATVVFPTGNGPAVTVIDGGSKASIGQDYRWIIEEDRTFYVDPTKLTNTGINNAAGTTSAPSFGTSFHTSYMPVVAQGCTGTNSCESGQSLLGKPGSCDYTGICTTTVTQKQITWPTDVALDPTKRYFLSVLPGDAIDVNSGHAMGGASIIWNATTNSFQTSDGSNKIIVEPLPLQPATLSVFVFEDDYPLNGQYDTGGGVDVLSPDEAGLGSFNITIQDQVAQSGDSVGQLTYDMFNQPLSNALAGTIDPVSGVDACPISVQASTDPTQVGITGTIPVCPIYEADGKTLSPLAGHALIKNLPPGRYGVVANPGADRIANGEEWLQTNTLDGQKAHDAFIRVGEPDYFQEFGPAGYHSSIGFANPKKINARLAQLCPGGNYDPAGTGATGNACTHTVSGTITGIHMSRTPDERLYSTGSRDIFSYTQCYVSLGEPDGPDFAFAKCDSQGNFKLSNVPSGNFRISVFDQWNDQIMDGYATPVQVGTTDVAMGDVAVHQWKANLYTRTFFDKNGNGVSDPGEDGLALVKTHVRYRDGSFSNLNNTDLNGYANFNEVFPLFNWYVVETDTTRFKSTGTHVVYDTGGPVDSPTCTGPTCSTKSLITRNLASSVEPFPLPQDLWLPGSVYCATADCSSESIQHGNYYQVAPVSAGTWASPASTGRIDPPYVETYGWQSFSGQGMWLEFGKAPYDVGENGGISGHVVYASTRPFDDPALLVQNFWEPLVPHVTINLYQEVTAPDGTTGLKLVDSTQTSSWDDWSQGYRHDASGNLVLASDGQPIPNISCPGQDPTDPFYFTIKDQQTYFNPKGPLPYNSQYKCYDGMHNWNQLQPAPYDGMYKFPSIVNRDPQTGHPVGTGMLNGVATTMAGTNCSICTVDPSDKISPMLPAGKYVVEVVVPPGYELVKEEDKNILTGDAYIAPAIQQIGGLANVFILPDQASVSASLNPNNAQNSTTSLGSLPRTEGDTPDVEEKWPCVGEARVVPDYLSIFPTTQLVAPFAGSTRNLCDRKEVSLVDQRSVHAKFYIFTSAHVAAHLTGIISDDFSAEFDPFSPAWGEKFSPPNMPVSIKDWAGNEVQRVYADQWGTYNALTYSTWGVNPPDPSGYVPQMMVTCMNDRGTGLTPDPLYQPDYSQFCYELSFMPGDTMYGDTPVIPTSSFANNFNHPDCTYPDTTPGIKSVTGDVAGPWVSAVGRTLTITSLGKQMVPNNAYSGPQATAAPFNQKQISRNYGFGTTKGTVTIGGVVVPAATVSWSDGTISFPVPAGVPNCTLQQQGQTQKCGQLVVMAANGKSTVDSVTVTIGGTTPTVLASGQTIQNAVDNANPGDLIIVPAGTYHEMVLMWKPVRLQGAGAASVTIDASTHPSGLLLEPWRREVVCLFGLAMNGRPVDNSINPSTGQPNNPFDASGTYTCPASQFFQVDRLPLEATVGWDATLNGNLAEQLQEPTIMGAYEGAPITVLGKGVNFPDPTQAFASDVFPTGTTLLNSGVDCNLKNKSGHHFGSNFYCNPSRIDGLTLTDSSQGGGGLFVHGWAHNLEISNNRVYNNQGTLGGGMTIGQGEHPPAYIQSGAIELPGSCESTRDTQLQLPYCFDVNVNMHNNNVSQNSSEGDELFSSTPSGAGGIAIGSGADYYKLTSNWVCGNFSTGDGGGVSQLGFIKNADIEHNTIIFNQSTNPTIPTNGGGLMISAGPDTDAICNINAQDTDCPTGLGDGIGPGMIINANLIQGNSADSGAGGGLRLQGINGSEISRYPNNPAQWYSISITNNIITNNVAGWDGGGVSIQDAMVSKFINNTITDNDSTASSGTLFQTFRRDLASATPPSTIMGTCDTSAAGCTASQRQPAGISVAPNSPFLIASYPATGIKCPVGEPNCAKISDPVLNNNIVWHNRSFHIELGSQNNQYNQTAVTLTPQLNQTATGSCDSTFPSADYWDLGVRGDLNAGNHGGTNLSLHPLYSVLSSTTGYDASNKSSDPTLSASYCNGSKVPPEFGGYGFQVPPGTDEGNLYANHYFTLTAGATTDESNNWINMSWGPLAFTNMAKSTTTGIDPDNSALSNSALNAGSPAIDAIPTTASTYATAPSTDFFGNPRPDIKKTSIDVGAIEYQAPAGPALTVAGGPLNFGNVVVGSSSSALTVTLNSSGTTTATAIALAFSGPFSRSGGTCSTAATFTLASGANCTIGVIYTPTAPAAPQTGTLAITSAGITVTGSPVALSGTGVAATHTASVTPSPLAFGSWATGTTSNPLNLTVTNTGNSALAGGTFTFGGGTAVYSRVTGGSFPAGAPNCAATLAVGASCTIKVQFAPGTATGALNRNLTVAYTGATVTPTPVLLTGTGVATRGTVTVTPNPLSITLPSGTLTGSGTVTFTNNSTSTSSVAVTGVSVSGAGLIWAWTKGADTCTGTNLAPGASCTVQAAFTRVGSVGTHTGSISFTSTATGSPHTAVLTGVAQ
jgi:hypothetical protein